MVDNFSVIISNAKENGKLIFKNSGIKTIPRNNLKVSFNEIYYIDLSGNKFTGLPDVITEFICLQVLLCSHNMIRGLTSNINNILYLETLDLSCNHLTSLPSISKLLCLKVLIISSNRLVCLPASIGRLSSLEELDASCNSITCLPEDLSSLNRLRYLNLRHNKLLDLPTNLFKLDLEVFDLSENQLTTIPSEYHRIETLQTLNLSGNPLNFPPANVCNKGLQHIMKYLQSESKRQSNRKCSTQNSVDYSSVNGCYKSEPLPFEINGADSITITSSNSQHSRCDFDFDLDSNYYDDCPGQCFDNNPVVDGTNINLIRQDSGFVAMSDLNHDEAVNYHQIRRDSASAMPAPVSPTGVDGLLSDNSMCPVLSTIDESIVKPDQSVVDGTLKKNHSNVQLNSNRNAKIESPSSYRSSSRYVMKNNPTVDVTKNRRSSVPSKERVAQIGNSSNQEIDISSQCVVVVDNSNNESRKSSAHSVHNQSNNSSSNRFIKNVSASPLRIVRAKVSDQELNRRTSIKSDILSSKVPISVDTNLKIQEKINKFHKIIEAQLHVHINSKNLSEELSNGIYLCHLANILIPHSIPTVHTPSPGQQDLGKQKSKRNLDNFLETCRRNGAPENCLFNARDVLNCNPIGLLHMAEAVDALIESIRHKRSRPSLLDHRSSSNIAPRIDWHSALTNPQSLSYRGHTATSTRSSLSGYRTVGRPSKTTHRIVTANTPPSTTLPNDDIIQYSSEV